jgi:hypothetical protein
MIKNSSENLTLFSSVTSLIFLFSIIGGFYNRIKSIKTPFGGAELTEEKLKNEEIKKELEANTLNLIKEKYQNLPETYPFEPTEGIIDAVDLTIQDLKKIQKYKKILEDINND